MMPIEADDFTSAWKAKIAERQREAELGPPVATMDIFEVRNELKSYKPMTNESWRDPVFLARRAALWKRIDRHYNRDR